MPRFRKGSRPERTSAKCPIAIACTIALPRAEASDGLLTTWHPLASAVIWHNTAFRPPPPTMRIVRSSRTVKFRSDSRTERYFRLRLSNAQRAISPAVSGAACPLDAQYWRIAHGISHRA
jgi:hypothetical protein